MRQNRIVPPNHPSHPILLRVPAEKENQVQRKVRKALLPRLKVEAGRTVLRAEAKHRQHHLQHLLLRVIKKLEEVQPKKVVICRESTVRPLSYGG